MEAQENKDAFPTKINQLLDDLRVQKDQNKIMKQKVIEAEKSSLAAHQTMVGLE